MEFLSLKGGCRGSSESTLVKIPNCWKSHVMAHLSFLSDKIRFDISCANNAHEMSNFDWFLKFENVVRCTFSWHLKC